MTNNIAYPEFDYIVEEEEDTILTIDLSSGNFVMVERPGGIGIIDKDELKDKLKSTTLVDGEFRIVD